MRWWARAAVECSAVRCARPCERGHDPSFSRFPMLIPDECRRPRAAGIRAPRSARDRRQAVGTADAVTIAARPSRASAIEPAEDAMAKKQPDAVYKIVEVVGVSDKWGGEGGRGGGEPAAGSRRALRVAEVTKMDMKLKNGKVAAFRTRVSLSLKYEAGGASQTRQSGRGWSGGS